MNFYNHPLINKIVEHKISSKFQLLELSGMEEVEFRKVFKSLVSNWHLHHRDEQIRLRTLILTVIDKVSKRYIEEIELKYMSRKVLNRFMVYDENSEDFLEGCFLEEKHASYFAEENDIVFNFKENEYNLYIGYVNLNHNPKKYWVGTLPPVIVQVDSYQIFAQGVRTFIEQEFPECRVQYFTHAEYAWKYLKKCFNEVHNIQLIVTDISLHGINGVEFAKAVWNLENECNEKHIPIMALTMHGEGSPIRDEALKENTFDIWFTKDVEPEEIKEYIKSVIEY